MGLPDSVRLPAPIVPWPPIIDAARRPRWGTIRDAVLTLFAWLLVGALLRDLIALVREHLRSPPNVLNVATDLDLFWEPMRFFVLLTFVMVVSLTVWAFSERRRLWGVGGEPQPAPLTTREQAEWSHMDVDHIEAARDAKILQVRFHPDGTLARVEIVQP